MPRIRLTASFIKAVKVDKRTEYFDDHTKGLGLRVSPSGSRIFFYRYRHNEKLRRYTIGQYSQKTFSLSDARIKAEELRLHVKRGGDPQGEEKAIKNARPKTLHEVVEIYKERHLSTLKDSTQIDYKRRIKIILKEFGEERQIKGISRPEILNFLEDQPPVQAQRIQAILSGIFKFALNREWVESNIATNINLDSKRVERKRKWQNIEFNDEQIRSLWKAFDQQDEPVRSLFMMLLILGQRSGETRKMKWSDIDMDQQIWTIPEKDTKNSLTHYVPLPQKALEILEERRNWTGDNKYVFESPIKENQPIKYVQHAAKRIREKHGIEEFNIHSLRTTVATRLAALGTPPQVLSKILNHKKPGEGSTITAIYNKYDYEDEKKIAFNNWESCLFQITEGDSP